MSTFRKFAILLFIFGSVTVAALIFTGVADIAVLNPKGMIGSKQRDLLWISTGLMLIVVLPVLLLTFIIGWKYRAENKKAKYSPDWDHSFLAECIWWGVPFLIVVALGIYNWRGSVELNPFKPIEGKKEITIQVVALQWKWLFIYPEEKIASVNYVLFPKDTSVRFEITADAPMNSFWIPQLGGQIYAMSGALSKLHLIASDVGKYRGCSAQISGKGFSSMNFTAESEENDRFNEWVDAVKGSRKALNYDTYKLLAEPSEYNPPSYYVLEDEGLFKTILQKYKYKKS